MREKRELDVTENPLYHDAWTLLKKYRTVVWNLELAVQRVRTNFQVEYGSSIEDFLESIYLAGVDFDESGIAAQAKSIERSHKMIKLVDRSVEVLRERHMHGEEYYWILFYSFLSPQQYQNSEEVVMQLQNHIKHISYRSYFRKRKAAIEAFSSVLWGYTTRDSLDILNKFFPENEDGT